MTPTFHANVIDRFQKGARLVQVVSEPGVTRVMTKEGLKEAAVAVPA